MELVLALGFVVLVLRVLPVESPFGLVHWLGGRADDRRQRARDEAAVLDEFSPPGLPDR